MKIKVIKRKSIADLVQVKREKSLAEIMAENDKLVKKLDEQFNNILAEIKVINRVLADKVREDK